VRSQLTHAAPPEPHAIGARLLQVDPVQQPLGQVVALQPLHAPPTQV
jgi:hypothetical protein